MGKIVKKSSKLKRPRHPMPGFVRQALEERGLIAAYKARPAYQQNDYIGWINNAKLQETKGKRGHQMLEELEKGCVYIPCHQRKIKKDRR